jgi:integrase/recombinase XerD
MVFNYDPELQAIAKRVKGAEFSGSKKFWHVVATEENLKEILKTFRDKADIDISAIAYRDKNEIQDLEAYSVPDSGNNTGDAPLENTETSAILKSELPTNVKKPFIKHKNCNYGPVQFRIDDRDGRLSIKFLGIYDKEWIDEIKSYGKVYYDQAHKEFLLTWSKITTDSLSDYFASKNIEVRVIRQKLTEEIRAERRTAGDEVRSRVLRNNSLDGIDLLKRYLEESRYSNRTIESYLTGLEMFFKYYSTKNPDEISQKEVSDFINDFIVKKGFSSSYQNQVISAIKMFYEISGRGRIIPAILERPRRGRSLPKVFSKDEIKRILNSGRNQKHKLLLWMIYSCGLRRSEVINILLTDLDRTRSILHIREAKGKVDRIVPVSEKVWQKIDEYLSGYMPQKYLFEGQNGGKYSSESVYNVFKQALKKSGIKKDVGVHSLRHSYATHLHESGLDIRYIQELLGHKSTKTTEIYTHVSRRNLISVRSPIEDIDVK